MCVRVGSAARYPLPPEVQRCRPIHSPPAGMRPDTGNDVVPAAQTGDRRRGSERVSGVSQVEVGRCYVWFYPGLATYADLPNTQALDLLLPFHTVFCLRFAVESLSHCEKTREILTYDT